MENRLKREQIEGNLLFIKSWMFEKTYDSQCEYSSNSDLYFVPLESRKYLVLNHYNVGKKIELQGFDLWVSEYESSNDIGKKKALSISSIKHGFDIKSDKTTIDKFKTSFKSK